MQSILSKFYKLPTNRDTLLVGIDGGGAVGKSTIAEKMIELDENVTIVHMDDFYRPSQERNFVNPDIIGANFDWDRVRSQVLIPLRRDEQGRYQRYDWDTDQMVDIELQRPSERADVIIDGTGTTGDISHYEVNVLHEGDRWLSL
ncbi:uridine kinase family protein [Alicyclobacillus dauci]|uniref:Uridine kinase n=1 Tax=Alicyclobacillus dauci TaxID=1475485 RepID=A0ABY6Z286_9BACL|nr:hypothetical protein [Alicyclobacillus dauci]WAH36718.1 hypothetical protein NZD86_21505 [Alicyclobacillus dauci]